MKGEKVKLNFLELEVGKTDMEMDDVVVGRADTVEQVVEVGRVELEVDMVVVVDVVEGRADKVVVVVVGRAVSDGVGVGGG